MAEAEDFNPEDKTFLDLQARAVALNASVAGLAGMLEQQVAARRLRRQDEQGPRGSAASTAPEQVQTPAESSARRWIASEQFTSYRMKGSSGVLTIDDDVQTRALPTGVADLLAAGLTGGKTTDRHDRPGRRRRPLHRQTAPTSP